MNTRPEPGTGRPDPGLDAIMGERRQLINLTYRLLGSLAEAEDAVQETYSIDVMPRRSLGSGWRVVLDQYDGAQCRNVRRGAASHSGVVFRRVGKDKTRPREAPAS